MIATLNLLGYLHAGGKRGGKKNKKTKGLERFEMGSYHDPPLRVPELTGSARVNLEQAVADRGTPVRTYNLNP